MKVFTRGALIKANRVAIKTGRNRTLVPRFLNKLDPAQVYPVTISMVHNDQEIRVGIMLDTEGHIGYLDIPFETFRKLPEVEVFAENTPAETEAASI